MTGLSFPEIVYRDGHSRERAVLQGSPDLWCSSGPIPAAATLSSCRGRTMDLAQPHSPLIPTVPQVRVRSHQTEGLGRITCTESPKEGSGEDGTLSQTFPDADTSPACLLLLLLSGLVPILPVQVSRSHRNPSVASSIPTLSTRHSAEESRCKQTLLEEKYNLAKGKWDQPGRGPY